jgi:hypothetical protein
LPRENGLEVIKIKVANTVDRRECPSPFPDQDQPNATRILSGRARTVLGSGSNDMSEIKEHMEVIGADGVHVGTVDRVEGNRIKLAKKDSGEGSHKGHHHYIDRNLVADVEGNQVRLSAIGAVAVTMEEEK